MRLALFYLVLVVAQGFLGALMAPLPPPDLFLIGVLTLLYRLPAWQLVLLGYGAGLVQDLVGHGALGVHALGLAGAALVASTVRLQLSQAGPLQAGFVVSIQVVQAVHLQPQAQQALAQVEADETGGAGNEHGSCGGRDQNCHGRNPRITGR